MRVHGTPIFLLDYGSIVYAWSQDTAGKVNFVFHIEVVELLGNN